MSCTYVYNNKSYTEAEIVDAIRKGNVKLGDVELARQNLKRLLNLEDSELEIVHGLMENDAVGKLMTDGRILLSTAFVQGDEYHEAFHRVFQMLISEDQRRAMLLEYKARRNSKIAIQNKQKEYGGISEDAAVEELLAEEFMMYQLNDGNYTVPPPVESIFKKILNFLRKVLGIRNIEEVYALIRKGEYAKTKVKQYPRTVKESRVSQEPVYKQLGLRSEVELTEIVEAIVSYAVQSVYGKAPRLKLDESKLGVRTSGLDNSALTNGDLTQALTAGFTNVVMELATKGDPYSTRIAENILNNHISFIKQGDEYKPYRNADSNLNELVEKRINQFNIVSKEATVKYTEVDDEAPVQEGDEIVDGETSKDFAFMKSSVEYDPKADVTLAIKLLLTSLTQEETSENLGLPKIANYDQIAAVLFKTLADTPATWEAVQERLESIAGEYSWVDPLIERLEPEADKDIPLTTINRIRDFRITLRSQFLRTFVRASYDMYTFNWDKDSLRMYNNRDETDVRAVISSMKDYVQATFSNKDQIIDIIADREETITQRFKDVFGYDVPVTLLNDLVSGTSLNVRLSNILSTVEEALTYNDINTLDIFKKELIGKNRRGVTQELDIYDNLNKVVEYVSSKGTPREVMIFNHEGKRVYPYTMHTYQTRVASYLNYVVDKYPITEDNQQEAIENRIQLLRSLAPQLFTPFNFDEKGRPTSLMLKRILESNNKYRIGIVLGVKSTNAVDAKLLTEADLITVLLRGIDPYTPNRVQIFTSLKHGDRGLLFTGAYENGATYFDSTSESLLDNDFINYLSQVLVDEVRFIKSNQYKGIKTLSSVKDLKLFSSLNLTQKDIDDIYNRKNTTVEQKKKLKKLADSLVFDFRELMIKHNLLQDHVYSNTDNNGKPIWLSGELYDRTFNLNETLKYAIYNHAVHYIEEARVLSGTISQYKNIADFFKRVQSLSSSGNNLDTSELVNEKLNLEFSTPFKITKFNGEQVELERYSDYDTISNAKIREEVITGPVNTSRNLDSLEQIFRDGLQYEAQFTNKLTPEVIEERVQEWKSAYSKYEEADGATYINIFMYKQYKKRQGKWSFKDENAFQIELAVLALPQNKSIADLVVYETQYPLPNGDIISALSATSTKGSKPVKVFDVGNFKRLKRFINPFTMEKPIYTGPVEIEYTEGDTKVTNDAVLAIRKTSFHVLVPSLIRKSKTLSELNEDMLINGIDMKPLDSAAKLGVPASTKGFYDPVAEDRNLSTLDFKYLSEQLPVSSTSKGNIKNATQSVKIMLMDMMNNGVPKDVKPEDRLNFEIYSEAAREEMSSVYKVVNKYKNALNDLITLKKARLLKELDVAINDIKKDVSEYDLQASIEINNIEKIKELLLDQVDGIHIVEAIEKMSNRNKSIDTLPSYRRLESVLFSIVTNNIIIHKRPGDMKPQFAVSGFESEVEYEGDKVLSSNALKFYRVENGEVKPAEVMMPLDLDRIPLFLKYVENKSKKKITNVVQAINIYNSFSDDDKLFIKGLRIPNQQTSFNGIYTVKEFMLPTVQSMIILPSESVPQSSTDFDIDKKQIYYQTIDSDGNIAGLRSDGTFDTSTADGIYNQLLYAERDLLLHESNIHHLLAPVNEGFLSDALFKKQMIKHKNYTDEYIDSNRSEMTIPMKANDFFSPSKHIQTSIAMSQSKVNVGKVATSQTLHAVAQQDGLTFNETYTDLLSGEKYTTRLPIEGGDGLAFGSIYSEDGRHISETVSTVLTSLLDGIKDNYGVMLNITNTTIPTITLLLRKGVAIETVLDLIMQPSVMQYVIESDFRNSTVAYARGARGKADNAIANTVRKHNSVNKSKIGKDTVISLRNKMRAGKDLSKFNVTKKELADGTVDQSKALAVFLRAEELANTTLAYTLYSTPDTKSIRSMSQLEAVAKVQQELRATNLFRQNIEAGFFKPFYSSRDYYMKLLPQFYSMRNKTNGNILYKTVLPNFTSRLMRTSAQERFARIAESQVMSYFILSNIRDKNLTFDKLFKGRNSFINELRRMKASEEYKDNYLLQNLVIVTEEITDPLNPDTFVGAVRFDNRAASAYHYYLAYNAFKQLPDDVKNKLFIVNLYQGGLDYTRWSLDEVIDVDTKSKFLDLLKDMSITKNQLLDLQTRLVQWNPDVLNYREPTGNMYSGLEVKKDREGRGIIRTDVGPAYVAANTVIKRFDVDGRLFDKLETEEIAPTYRQSSIPDELREQCNKNK